MDRFKTLNSDEILGMLGLEVKRPNSEYLAPAFTVFAVGLLVGAGVGLLFAPRPGRELRDDLANRLQQAPDAFARIPQRASELSQRVGEAVHRVSDQAQEAVDKVKKSHSASA